MVKLRNFLPLPPFLHKERKGFCPPNGLEENSAKHLVRQVEYRGASSKSSTSKHHDSEHGKPTIPGLSFSGQTRLHVRDESQWFKIGLSLVKEKLILERERSNGRSNRD
mmetsp:Transcript_16636/g.40589  ORF Transcript_16636/g.40589 Transcript_16636/m.40589 type:complete len:109 (+) Transcript_16636:66-392(+)